MGGRKKPTLSQLEKRMKREKAAVKEKREKKYEMKLDVTGALTQHSLDQIISELPKMPCITPYVIASKFGIKISRAKKVLREFEARGLIRALDYNHRVPIYVPVKGQAK